MDTNILEQGVRNIKVLLIEDDPDDVVIMHEILDEAIGVRFNTVDADRLHLGLDIINQGDIDIVLTDLDLPDSAGLATLHEVVSAAKTVPVIALTGMSDQSTAVQAVAVGAQDYLVKGRFDGDLVMRSIGYAMERKRAEGRQKLMTQILQLLNQPGEMSDIIQDVLYSIKESTGLEAIGLRLNDGEDFPYYLTAGFPAYFVETESTLCGRDSTGRLLRDVDGRAVLECMCGNIIRGRTDPSQPFFTNGGSFWTNSTSELLAFTTEEDRQARTRNICNIEGYESVALIPLRTESITAGLLQFNDRRRDMFTPEVMEFFESLGTSIGIALARKQAEERIIKRINELAFLNQLAQTISQSIDLDNILDNALSRLLEMLDVDDGAVYIMDKQKDLLIMRHHRGLTDIESEVISTVEVGEGGLGTVALSGKPLFVESLTKLVESFNDGVAELVSGHQLKSATFVPLLAKGELLGVICAFTKGNRVFNREERSLVLTVSHQVSTAIENAQLLAEASRAMALEEAECLRQAFLTNVSHEVRTPLASIKGLASTLAQPDMKWDAAMQYDFLNSICQESDRLLRIFTDVLDMSKFSSGTMEWAKVIAKPETIIRSIESTLRDQTSGHNLILRLEDDLPSVMVDRVSIGQIITNLVSNAATYSQPETNIELEVKAFGDNMIASVTDQGDGIAAEHLVSRLVSSHSY